MKFATVCSGIGSPEQAWKSLGWECLFQSEIEKFPSAVLKHHHPEIVNYGDLLKHKEWNEHGIELLAAGTPCQSFSVAGLRKGLADPRGNLTLAFLGVVARYRPKWVVWENVPGILSDRENAFGTFLAGMAECGYGFAYRILDAQYFGLAQRRRRVFVVGHLGNWRSAAAVLFERESLSWNLAPSRKTREGIAPTISARTKGGGGLGTDFDCDGGYIPIGINGGEIGFALRSNPSQSGDKGDGGVNTTMVCATITKNYATHHGRTAGNNGGVAENQIIAVASTLRSCSNTKAGHNARAGDKDENLVVHSLRADGFDASEDGTGRGTPLVPEIAYALQERDSKGSDSSTKDGHLIPIAVKTKMGVRRLTPRECERLQGFPDDFSLIKYGNRMAKDGPRYKALGNSMAVPVLRWIGKRIEMVDSLLRTS